MYVNRTSSELAQCAPIIGSVLDDSEHRKRSSVGMYYYLYMYIYIQYTPMYLSSEFINIYYTYILSIFGYETWANESIRGPRET